MSQRIKNPEFFSQCHNPVLTPVTILPQGAGTVGAVRVTTGDTTVYTSPPAVTFTDESSTFTPANNGAYFVTASVSTATPAASAFSSSLTALSR